MREIENNWTRGIFRTVFREIENGNQEVTHRCVICKWHVTASYGEGDEIGRAIAVTNRVNRELLSHEKCHPEAKFICDWWAFKSGLHSHAARMSPWHGLDVLQWRN